MKKDLLQTRRRYVDARKHNAILILATPFILNTSFNLLRMSAKASEFVSPAPTQEAIIVEKLVPVAVPVYELPKTVEDDIRAVFGKDAETALKVAKCESNYNPKAKNKTSSARGVFQIMQSWHRINEKWLLNPSVNIRVAHQLFLEQGWNPWRASNHCHHALD